MGPRNALERRPDDDIIKPHVAVLYGRGRQIGSPFKGEAITESAVFNILSVIGSACECGLERKWVLGAMLPIRWGEKLQSEVVKLLGFNPESPMVKTEISQMLSLGRMEGADVASVGDELYRYREETLEFENRPTVAIVPFSNFRQPTSTEGNASGTGLIFRMTVFTIGGIVLFILTVSLFIILRTRRKID